MPLETTEKGVVHGWLAGESGWAGAMNDNLQRLSAMGAWPFSVDPVESEGLTLVVRGGPVRQPDGTWVFAADASLTMIALEDNYVERDLAGTISRNTTGFTAGRIPIAVVTCDGLEITRVEDWRPPTEQPLGLDHAVPVVKHTTQDVTNAGLTVDSELQFPVVSGASYLVELLLCVSGNDTTGDYQFDLQVSAGTMKGRGQVRHLNGSLAMTTAALSAASAAATGAVTCGVDADLALPSTVEGSFAFTASANGTFRVRFGNAAADTGRTSRTWRGSRLRYRRIA